MITRFLFEDLDIRGAMVQMDDVWQAVQHNRPYDARTRSLLGEMCAVTTIITSNLKNPGRITFQISGHGPLRMLVVDCDETLNLRALAKAEEDLSTLDVTLPELIGDGSLMLTLDLPTLREPYRSYVPVDGDSVADIFENYLEQSEQHPAFLWLFADEENASGLFLQKLPDADQKDSDGWARITHLAATVKAEELATLPATELLHLLFPEEDIRVFEPRKVRHDWPRNEGKIRTLLKNVGRAELEATLQEHGEVVISDELSNHTYRFSAEDIAKLWDDAAPSA